MCRHDVSPRRFATSSSHSFAARSRTALPTVSTLPTAPHACYLRLDCPHAMQSQPTAVRRHDVSPAKSPARPCHAPLAATADLGHRSTLPIVRGTCHRHGANYRLAPFWSHSYLNPAQTVPGQFFLTSAVTQGGQAARTRRIRPSAPQTFA